MAPADKTVSLYLKNFPGDIHNSTCLNDVWKIPEQLWSDLL